MATQHSAAAALPDELALAKPCARANVVVCGKFHLFNYIAALRQTGRLQRFYYSHRSFPEPKEASEYCQLPLKEYLIQGHLRLLGERFLQQLSPFYGDLFSRSVLRHWEAAPLLHVVSNGNCLPIADRAKKDGSRVIGEAVVVHPAYIDEIIRAESERWKVPFRQIVPAELQARHSAELDRTDVLLAPSKFVEKTYRDKGFRSDIAVIPYAANIQRFFPRRNGRTGRGPLKVLSVGQIGLRKGQLYLLEAVKRFKRSEVELTLIGTVSEEIRETLSAYDGVFTHINRISNVELAELHQQFDVFVLPSLAEGLAVSICEAMGSGLAVACTAESGGGEIIEDGVTGHMVPSRSVEALESFLADCVRNREAVASTGQRAAKSAHESVNWDRYVQKLVALYDDPRPV